MSENVKKKFHSFIGKRHTLKSLNLIKSAAKNKK